MNGTPRLRSAFPSTPQSSKKYAGSSNDFVTGASGGAPSPSVMGTQSTQKSSNEPLIPLHLLDGPTQRLYISSFYLALTVWRLYDYFGLVSDHTDSLWLFMKWVAIDSVFLYGLPGLRIPWLEWSSFTMTVLFLVHAVLNGLLMFRISVWMKILYCQFKIADMIYRSLECLDHGSFLSQRSYMTGGNLLCQKDV